MTHTLMRPVSMAISAATLMVMPFRPSLACVSDFTCVSDRPDALDCRNTLGGYAQEKQEICAGFARPQDTDVLLASFDDCLRAALAAG
ncbi:hypothetical protein P775_14780 [Puniceibacterium antarcticum]|uniref:Uncharacterized protein n=1 Tax=Puniceibacterium antarcticum TaxID=1206336 RepID=A0A2G8RCV2_9RHOB|nr:hypothetical protein [Puniceibacterium antarcticum]PIL19404.1 hypothetical protein P775_14780 [Puniceibacterium antarcticum]